MDIEYDVVIVGGGTSGIATALELMKKSSLRVALIEGRKTIGYTVSISGGGFCNITNENIDKKNYSKPEFVQYALRAWSVEKSKELARKYGMHVEEREHGRIFFTQSAQRFVYNIIQELEKYSSVLVQIDKNLGSTNIAEEENKGQKAICNIYTACIAESIEETVHGYKVQTTKGNIYGRYCVIALGSSAWSKSDAYTSLGAVCKKLQHSIRPFRPALAPLYGTHYSILSGISVEVRITINGHTVQDTLLFTHKGISGPAVLRASSQYTGGNIYIDFLPNMCIKEICLASPKKKLKNCIESFLPKRLVDMLIPSEYAEEKCSSLSKEAIKTITEAVHMCVLQGYRIAPLKKAEVAHGGIICEEVHAKTMESKKHNRLYIVGEALDSIGDLGGYNIHFALASGTMAGEHIKHSEKRRKEEK